MQSIGRLLVLGGLGMVAPAMAQTPAQDVTGAMQGQLGAQVREGATASSRNTAPRSRRARADCSPACTPTVTSCRGSAISPFTTRRHASSARSARSPMSRANAALTSRRIARTSRSAKDGVAQCLKDHASELSPGCGQALTNVACNDGSGYVQGASLGLPRRRCWECRWWPWPMMLANTRSRS